MQIESVEVFHLALPLATAMKSRWGEMPSLETVLVRISAGGLCGWGEASPGVAPSTSGEWAAGAFLCLKDWLAPAIAGRYIDSSTALEERLGWVRGNHAAKAAIDAAWWDLRAKAEGKPLHEYLGGTAQHIPLGASFDEMETIDQLLEALAKCFEAGYARAEVKLRPGWDVNMLNAVRHQFPVETIHADVEGGMRLDHMELLCRMDDFSLAMVEQPLPADDLVGLAMVQETLKTPVGLDDSIATVDQAAMAIELKSGRYANLRLGRVGGFGPATKIHDKCREASVPCFLGAVPQSAIGLRSGLALAAKANFSYPADWIAPADLLVGDVAPPPAVERGGDDNTLRARLWSEPGIGVEPDTATLDEYCQARATIR